jgi:uncharacterized protein (DUF305 family)
MRKWLTAVVLAVAAATLLAACGGNDDEGEHTITAAGNATDRAFVAGMIPHHESAIEMARVAQEGGQSKFVQSLADDIVRTQGEEINTMRAIDAELASSDVEVGDLGLSEQEMGMHGEMSDLENAKPFDRVFIDMMVPHHQGAIRMARVELAEGKNLKLRELARQIIDAQSREIEEMNAHRTEEFGGPSPSGGVPSESDNGTEDSAEGNEHSMDSMDSMDSMSH